MLVILRNSFFASIAVAWMACFSLIGYLSVLVGMPWKRMDIPWTYVPAFLQQHGMQTELTLHGTVPRMKRGHANLILFNHPGIGETMLLGWVILFVLHLRNYVIVAKHNVDKIARVGIKLDILFPINKEKGEEAKERLRMSASTLFGPNRSILLAPEGSRITPKRRARLTTNRSSGLSKDVPRWYLRPKAGGLLALLRAYDRKDNPPPLDVYFLHLVTFPNRAESIMEILTTPRREWHVEILAINQEDLPRNELLLRNYLNNFWNELAISAQSWEKIP